MWRKWLVSLALCGASDWPLSRYVEQVTGLSRAMWSKWLVSLALCGASEWSLSLYVAQVTGLSLARWSKWLVSLALCGVSDWSLSRYVEQVTGLSRAMWSKWLVSLALVGTSDWALSRYVEQVTGLSRAMWSKWLVSLAQVSGAFPIKGHVSGDYRDEAAGMWNCALPLVVQRLRMNGTVFPLQHIKSRCGACFNKQGSKFNFALYLRVLPYNIFGTFRLRTKSHRFFF
jgi:hypothetical protein